MDLPNDWLYSLPPSPYNTIPNRHVVQPYCLNEASSFVERSRPKKEGDGHSVLGCGIVYLVGFLLQYAAYYAPSYTTTYFSPWGLVIQLRFSLHHVFVKVSPLFGSKEPPLAGGVARNAAMAIQRHLHGMSLAYVAQWICELDMNEQLGCSRFQAIRTASNVLIIAIGISLTINMLSMALFIVIFCVERRRGDDRDWDTAEGDYANRYYVNGVDCDRLASEENYCGISDGLRKVALIAAVIPGPLMLLSLILYIILSKEGEGTESTSYLTHLLPIATAYANRWGSGFFLLAVAACWGFGQPVVVYSLFAENPKPFISQKRQLHEQSGGA